MFPVYAGARLAQSVEHQTFKAVSALELSEGQGFKSLIGRKLEFLLTDLFGSFN